MGVEVGWGGVTAEGEVGGKAVEHGQKERVVRAGWGLSSLGTPEPSAQAGR